MAVVLLPHPAQLKAERPWHQHVAGCRTCQEAAGHPQACAKAQQLHEDAVQAAHEAHFGVLRAGHEVKLALNPPVETWRIWHYLLSHPVLSQVTASGPLAGLDISAYQGSVNFDQAAAGNWYIIPKATEGVGYVDPYFARSWNEIHRVGRIPGGYHFSRPDLGNSPEAECDFFLSVTGASAGSLLAHDAESAGGNDQWCRAWKDHLVARTQYAGAFYSYLSWINTRGIGGGSSLHDSWLWLAWPDANGGLPVPAPWANVAIQQYGLGGVPGISGQVDLDRFFGSLDELRALTLGGGGDGLPDENTFKQWVRDVLNEGTAFGEVSWHQTNSDHVGLLQTVNNDLRAVHSELNSVVNLLVGGNTGDDNKWDSYVKKAIQPQLDAIKAAIVALPPEVPGGPGGTTDLQPVLTAIASLRTVIANLTLSASAVPPPSPSPAPAPAPTPAPAPSPTPPPPTTGGT